MRRRDTRPCVNPESDMQTGRVCCHVRSCPKMQAEATTEDPMMISLSLVPADDLQESATSFSPSSTRICFSVAAASQWKVLLDCFSKLGNSL